MHKVQPFNLSELEAVASLEAPTMEFIVYSDDPEYYQCETTTRSKAGAWNALRNFKDGHVPDLHLHQVSGRTEHPVAEDAPIAEACINHACRP